MATSLIMSANPNFGIRAVTLFICLCAALLTGPAETQSALPPCSGTPSPMWPNASWDNCAGTFRGIASREPFYGELIEYTGEFKRGRWEGQGRLTRLSVNYPDGERYVGEFKSGTFSGTGAYTFANGTKSIGQWRRGKLNGYAVIYGPDGGIQAFGVFNNGNIVPMSSLNRATRLAIEERRINLEREVREREEADELRRQQIRQEQVALETRRQAEEARLRQERSAAEQARIEREGDGSEDDLACKARKLKPSTDPYKKCRNSLATARQAREERERLLAEQRYQANVKRARQERIAADRKREQQEARERRREEAAAKDPYFYVKEQCRELGFKDKTEKFGTCVLELSKRGGDQQTRSESSTARGDGTPDDATCVGYGYAVGSTGYADCRLKLDQARRDYERELRAYQAEKAAYEQRVAEIEAEKRRQQSERQIRYGACLANCAGDFLSCASRCGYASVGVSPDIGAPPARPSGRTTYVINGRIINCNTTPSGSVVTCN